MFIKAGKIVLATIFIFGINSASFAQNVPKIRELSTNSASINNQVFNNNRDNIYKSKEITKKLENSFNTSDFKRTASLKGGLSEIRAVAGKSQLIKFDEDVKRISVTDSSLVDIVIISPREIMINGKSGGETTLIIWGEKEVPIMFNLFVDNTSINFIKEVKRVDPDDDIKIDFINTGEQKAMKVRISGRISSSIKRDRLKDLAAAYGYTLIDMTETLTPQVMLEVKIIEFTKDKNNNTTSMPSLFMNNTDEKVNSAITKFTYNLKHNSTGDYSGTIDIPKLNLEMALKKAESDGVARVLASPKLMTTDKNEATFNVVQEFPIIKGRDEYGGLIIEYKNAGITLVFTPEILEESGRIKLKITPTINEPTASALATVDGFPVYGFNTSTTTTNVELEDNQTMVIGGLIKKTSSSQKTRVPYLSHLPIIGDLLGEDSISSKSSELMIFVTPTIIKPDDVVNGV